MSSKVAVVTGSNSGVGLAIVRAFCKHFGENGAVYLTARNEERGMQAIEVLKKEGLNPRFHLLDVDDVSSMEMLRDDIRTEHGGLDILVNNAGIAYKGNPPMFEQAVGSIKTNYHGVRLMTDTFLPIIRDGGRITHVASMGAPMAYYRLSVELQERFKQVSTVQDVTNLMNEFIEATKIGDHVQKGWPDWAYGTSKLGVVALTKIQGENVSKDSSKKDVLINSCCPGYVATGMTAHHTGEKAKHRLTPDQGADTPVYLSLLPAGTTNIQGKFLYKREIKDFFTVDIRPITLI
ncbi:carbonyl reductase [NADPH] 1-like isoform X2 [Lytechinus variegatus]|uniref:carbonyl reductase [NADPH] 1-like isoform X2 n=1 Tax=Lytechinus variegatus TaxID=7654 RepID=UPI001BB1DD88|nr:carbonyl reductase [NADPH] 1-like isoform X2 [Lytechinus variegatus]